VRLKRRRPPSRPSLRVLDMTTPCWRASIDEAEDAILPGPESQDVIGIQEIEIRVLNRRAVDNVEGIVVVKRATRDPDGCGSRRGCYHRDTRNAPAEALTATLAKSDGSRSRVDTGDRPRDIRPPHDSLYPGDTISAAGGSLLHRDRRIRSTAPVGRLLGARISMSANVKHAVGRGGMEYLPPDRSGLDRAFLTGRSRPQLSHPCARGHGPVTCTVSCAMPCRTRPVRTATLIITVRATPLRCSTFSMEPRALSGRR